MVYAFFFRTKSTSEAVVDRPELQVALSNFLSAYFADEWDTVESQIEIDHFKRFSLPKQSQSTQIGGTCQRVEFGRLCR